MMSHVPLPLSMLMLTTLAFASPEAAAVQFRVGSDAACSHTTLQAAVNALPASGAHEIRIANSTSYTAQAITISGRTVTMIGGYATCDAAGGGTRALLNGAGGSSNSVLTIGGSGNDIVLENLNLIRGDEVYDGYGGGIDFRGNGTLTLRNVGISQNYAGYGGGISFAGEGGQAELRIEAGTTILLNTAQFSGGGVRLEGSAKMTMIAPDSVIAQNEARGINPVNNQPLYGTGGGVQIIAPAEAHIGSPGIGNGTIVDNSARYGGGIAAVGSDNDLTTATVFLFSTDPQRAVRVYRNRASNTGGGIYLDGNAGSVANISRGRLCAYDARIDGNVASEGSAVYADTDYSSVNFSINSTAYFNVTGNGSGCLRPAGGVRCAAGVACNTIEGNRTQNSTGTATSGAAILVQNEGIFKATRLDIRNNVGAHALRAFEAEVDLNTVAFAGNTVSAPLLRLEDGSSLKIADSTVAGNTIEASQVVSLNGSLEMRRSILWQPGKTSLTQSGGGRIVDTVYASEADSLGGGATVTPPRLVDPERGDVRLRAASPAVDRTVAIVGNDVDLDHQLRDRRLAVVPREDGYVRDLGAYERQTLAPLLYNADFDVDTHQWTAVTTAASWDGTQNGVGATGSGSAKISLANSANGQRVSGMRQCIHLPGPGTYALNGFGRSGAGAIGNRDYVYLNWEFRRSGGEACNSGVATLSGDHFLANSASWQRPSNPKLITVSQADWTSTSSITITHLVVENGISAPATAIGWADGITLAYIDPNDTIFRNGFD